MEAIRLAFFRVARGAAISPAVLRPDVEDVSDFLVAHANELREKAATGGSSDATFNDPTHEQVLLDLSDGDNDAFLAAATALGSRLVEEMGKVGNTEPGLLVCVTYEDDTQTRSAAVLKLQVVSKQGAVLKQLDSGEETLAAVKDVLDEPGKLQKGVVVPDDRPGSAAIVGDKSAAKEARYFLRAMGVTLEARPQTTAGSLVKAVAARATKSVTDRVIQVLPTIQAASPSAVIAAIRQQVPDLPQAIAAEVVTELLDADRPVRQVTTTAPVTGKIRAGALTVQGPAEDIRQVAWEETVDGKWTVSFRVDIPPTVTYQ